MTTHTKTLLALMGVVVGVLISERTIYGSELAVFMLLLGSMQLVIHRVSEYVEIKKRSEVTAIAHVVRFTIPLACGIFCISVFLMIVRMQFSEQKSNFVCEQSCTFSASIVSAPKIKHDLQIFSVQVSGVRALYNVQIKTPLYPKYEEGEQLVLSGKVTPPHEAMPHDGKKTFDYISYLHTNNIGSEMYFPKIETSTTSRDTLSFLKMLLIHFHSTLVKNIFMYVNAPASSLASGMLFGDDSMSEELMITFRVSGISHIVVLSGFNIAILISFVLLVLIFVPLFLRVIFASALVILFVLMVGAEASIVRATLMSFIGLFALMVGRGYVARQALLVSLIAIVVYEPIHLLHDASLHLSFLATAGIVYMSDGVRELFRGVSLTSYKEILTTSLAAYIATLPYVMFTFGTVSVYALLTNIIVLPLVPLMMLVTFFVALFSLFLHPVALMFGYVDTILGQIIIFVARTVSDMPFASLTISLSLLEMSVSYVVLIFMYLYIVKRCEQVRVNETPPTKSDGIISEIIPY